MINQRGVNLPTMSQSRMSRSTRLKRKNRPKTCAESSQKDRLPCAEARQSSAEAKVDPMNSSPSGTPSKIDIRLSFSDLGGTISRISLGKCFKNMRGLNLSKTSKYVEATTDSNAPSRRMRIVSNKGPSPRCRPFPSAWGFGAAEFIAYTIGHVKD